MGVTVAAGAAALLLFSLVYFIVPASLLAGWHGLCKHGITHKDCEYWDIWHGHKDDWRKSKNSFKREAPTRQTRAMVEEHIRNVDLLKLLNGKCFDKAPNCEQEFCQNHNISLRKKCKKTCGDCDPIKNKRTK